MSSNFFVNSIGSHILRGDNPIFIKDYAMAIALFKLQDDKYKFRPVIHTSDKICVACE